MKKLKRIFVVLSIVLSAIFSVSTLPARAEETPLISVDDDPVAVYRVSKKQYVTVSAGWNAEIYVQATAYKSGSEIVEFEDMYTYEGRIVGGPITYEVNRLYVYNGRLWWALQIKVS